MLLLLNLDSRGAIFFDFSKIATFLLFNLNNKAAVRPAIPEPITRKSNLCC